MAFVLIINSFEKMATSKTKYTIGQRVAIIRIHYQKNSTPTEVCKGYRTQIDKHSTIRPATVKK